MSSIVRFDPPSVIYVATFPNGKRYVGRTSNFKYRLHSHRHQVKIGSKIVFHCAIRKHGWPHWDIVWRGPWSDSGSAESWLIDRLDTYLPNGYNMSLGGEGQVGYVPSDATREKLSAAAKGRPITEEHKKRISEANKGRPRPDLAEMNRKRLKGRPMSDEQKAKLSKALKGRKRPPRNAEWIANLTKAITGRKLSLEHRKKIGIGGRRARRCPRTMDFVFYK